MSTVMVESAAMSNLRRIRRHLVKQRQAERGREAIERDARSTGSKQHKLCKPLSSAALAARLRTVCHSMTPFRFVLAYTA